MLPLTLATLAAVAAGAALERVRGAFAERIAAAGLRLLLYVLMPLVVVTNVRRLALTPAVAGGVAIAYLVVVLVGLLAWGGARRLRLPRPTAGATIAAAISANSGYLGIPLAHALLGDRAVPAAILYDLAVGQPTLYVGVFGIAAAMGSAAPAGGRATVRAYLRRNLAIPAAILGVLLPQSALAGGLSDLSQALIPTMAPIGFFALGATLPARGQRAVPHVPPAVGLALALRMAAAPCLMTALSAVVPGVPHAFLLSAAMPCGLATLAVAHAYGLDRRTLAAAIAWSTAVLPLSLLAAFGPHA
jgi:malate permease and related proteins